MIRIRLSNILGELRWTQKKLAKEANIRPATINELYHEMTDRVNLEHLDKICEVTGKTLNDLLEYIPNKKEL